MIRSWTCLIVAVGISRAAVPGLEDEVDKYDESLTLDDTCEQAENGEQASQCALNALQHKHHKLTVASSKNDAKVEQNASSNDTELEARPDGQVAHYALPCETPCKGLGWCESFCGHGGACCSSKGKNPKECNGIHFWPITYAATCVAPALQPEGTYCHHLHLGGEVKTLYHQTSKTAGPLIMKGQFDLGRRGWCGGAIYFATSPEATDHKTSGLDSAKGFVIEVKVRVGKIKHMPSMCDSSMTGDKLHKEGYDTIKFNPSDGTEYVIFCSSQVISKKHIRWPRKR